MINMDLVRKDNTRILSKQHDKRKEVFLKNVRSQTTYQGCRIV